MIFARGQVLKEAFSELLHLKEAKMVASAKNNSYVYYYMPTSLSTAIEWKESAKNNILFLTERRTGVWLRVAACKYLKVMKGRRDVVNHAWGNTKTGKTQATNLGFDDVKLKLQMDWIWGMFAIIYNRSESLFFLFLT